MNGIAQRFSSMLDQGFIAEVETLMRNPQMHADLPAMRADRISPSLGVLATED
jgi:tRNA A37 N6-isopentenylltransferase MiaA